MKSRKRLAHGIFDTAAIHASLDCDVTEMDCWAQNGYARGHDFATFNIDFQHRGGEIEFEKKIKKNYCMHSFLSCYSIPGPVLLLCFASPLTVRKKR